MSMATHTATRSWGARPATPSDICFRRCAGSLAREITDEAAGQAARADAWPKAVEFIRKLGTLK